MGRMTHTGTHATPPRYPRCPRSSPGNAAPRHGARLTRHLKGQQVLLIVDAGHHLAAVQPRVAGAGGAQQQRGVVAVVVVARQGHPALVGFHHLHRVVLGHQDGDVLPLAGGRAHLAPFDAGRVGGLVGPQRGGRLEQEEAGQGHGLPQPHAHGLVLHPVDVDHLPIVLGACGERCPDTTGMGGGSSCRALVHRGESWGHCRVLGAPYRAPLSLPRKSVKWDDVQPPRLAAADQLCQLNLPLQL